MRCERSSTRCKRSNWALLHGGAVLVQSRLLFFGLVSGTSEKNLKNPPKKRQKHPKEKKLGPLKKKVWSSKKKSFGDFRACPLRFSGFGPLGCVRLVLVFEAPEKKSFCP